MPLILLRLLGGAVGIGFAAMLFYVVYVALTR